VAGNWLQLLRMVELRKARKEATVVILKLSYSLI